MMPKVVSAVVTTVVVVLVAIVLVSFGYDPPNPPIAEEGVEISLGESDYGRGTTAAVQQQASSYAPPSAEQEVATQSSEESVPMTSTPDKGTVTNPQAVEQEQQEAKEPEINQNALFKGNRNKKVESGGKGEGNGEGYQGAENGNPNSTNYTDAGHGVGFALDGRNGVSVPQPAMSTNKTGACIIKIYVDQQGVVKKAEGPYKGSTISDPKIVEKCKEAAMRSRFSANLKAPDLQEGTIRYRFEIGG